MNKTIEFINHILEMDKELESLRNKVKLLESRNKECSYNEVTITRTVPEKTSKIEQLIYDLGIETLYNETFYDWRGVRAERNKNGEVEYTTFNKFVKDSIRDSEIPAMISKNELIDVLDGILKIRYEDECNKDYEFLIEKEQEESEEEE